MSGNDIVKLPQEVPILRVTTERASMPDARTVVTCRPPYSGGAHHSRETDNDHGKRTTDTEDADLDIVKWNVEDCDLTSHSDTGTLRLRGGGGRGAGRSTSRDSKGRFTRGTAPRKNMEAAGESSRTVLPSDNDDDSETQTNVGENRRSRPKSRQKRGKKNKNVGESNTGTDEDKAEEKGYIGGGLGDLPSSFSEASEDEGDNPNEDDSLMEVQEANLKRSKRSSDEDAPERKKSAAPKAKGAYVGLQAAKARLQESQSDESEGDDIHTPRERSPDVPQLAESPEDPGERVRLCAQTVMAEAKKSGNLKGTIWGSINRACKELLKVADSLGESEIIRSLRADNKRMRTQLAQLESETKALRRAFSERQPVAPTPPTEQSSEVSTTDLMQEMSALLNRTLGKFKREMVITIGEKINARIEGIEHRLMPETTLRPPLAADRRKATAPPTAATDRTVRPGDLPEDPWTPLPTPTPTPAHVPAARSKNTAGKAVAATGSTLMPPARAAPGPKRAGGRKKGPTETPQVVTSRPQNQNQNPEDWTEVRKKGKKRKKRHGTNTAKAANPPTPARRKKLPVPKSAAIVVALKPGVEASYASVMAKATTSLKLAEVGLEHVTMRKTADGARIIEIPGADNVRAADDLRDRLENLVGDVARVYRPVKMARIQVAGLDETATPEMVANAVVAKAGCPQEVVKVGNIRMVRIGGGSALVQCPVTAANTLIEAGRLTVGWVSAQIRALGIEPMRCYRCMGTGHTRATCPSEVDRGELCYRCSKPGHKMAECSSEPFCAVCHRAKLPHKHHMGGRGCSPPKVKGLDTPARTPVDPANKESPMEVNTMP
ncbi:uncharacterized protein LOC125224977 [Leguminivora glycinivorella]|uniref:uncharacterized protein LOC125224977 n=1 Tax=Leguminivora glycinivorella TaxID=1035111 RepID=UPI00200EFA72|nr:uncharacterized protein LOC125224977 [Leguminivora glycinivorella]